MCLSNSQLTWPEVVGAKSRVNATDVSCRTQNMIACRIIVDVSVELKSQRAIIISNWLSNSQHAVIISMCFCRTQHDDIALRSGHRTHSQSPNPDLSYMALNDVSCPYEHLVIGNFGVCSQHAVIISMSVELGWHVDVSFEIVVWEPWS